MSYQNNFTVNAYFTENYGLGSRPSPLKLKLKAIPIIIGIILLIVGFAVIGDNTGLGLIFIVVSLGLLFIAIGIPIIKKSKQDAVIKSWDDAYNYRRKNWGAEFKKAYNARVESFNTKQRAMDKLGISEDDLTGVDESIKPFYVSGNNFDGWWRQLQDESYNSDKNTITWVFMSDKQIYFHTLTFQMTNKDAVTDSTQEFFYNDIVSVSTESSNIGTKNRETGKDITVSSEAFKIVVPGDKIYFPMSTSSDAVRGSIANMKTLIRNKKTGA